MKFKKTIVIFSMVMILSLAAGVDASRAGESGAGHGRFFMGLGYGYHDLNMDTDFTRRINGAVTEVSGFENTYNSNSGSLFAGYQYSWERFYLSWQIAVGIYDDEFDLTVGSSRITNALNHDIRFAVVPGIYLAGGLSAFAKAGLGIGDFDFVKSSPTSTTYDEGESLPGVTLGIGLAYDVTPKITVALGVEKTWYEDTQINAALGPLSDITVVAPEVETLFITVQYAFGK